MKTIYSGTYFNITETNIAKQKTKLYTIVNNSNFQIIGKIKWYSGWRKYCFFPETGTLWDSKCLNELTVALENINSNYKNNKEESDE